MPHSRPAPLRLALLSVAVLAAFAAADAGAAKKKPAKGKQAAAPAATACGDFYAYANKAWLDGHVALPEQAGVTALGELSARAQAQQRELLDAAMNAPQNEVQTLLGNFWASGLDEVAVEADGSKPIAGLLGRINAIKKPADVAATIAALHQVGIPVAFNFSADIDLNDLERHIGYLMQGGLGLPDPAYYTRTDAETRELLGRYRAYVQQILALTGTAKDRLDAESAIVIDLETRLAQASVTLTQLRDFRAAYAPVAIKDLGKQYRNLQLDAFLKVQGVKDDTISLPNPAYVRQLDALVKSLKPEQWKAYLRWRVGDAMAPYLAKSFRDAEFEFRGRVLRGQTAPSPRWQQVLDAINTAAGPMLGKEYAARYLPAASKAQAETVAKGVRDALEAAIARNAWLAPATRDEAKKKLGKLKIEIGTPRRDLDYSVQPMGRNSFGSNLLIASTWHHREEMKRIGKGNADRRWDVLPQQPALAYDLAQNRLIVTAAVLQPPVFDAAGDVSSQYGGFGALVGHELSRGFDNKGRMVDAKGDLRDWWTPADVAAWSSISARLAAQYDGYAWPVLKDVKVNGRQTADENMADLAGLELAGAAFATTQSGPVAVQQKAFYEGWARLWAQSLSPADATLRASTSPYAPGQWRANGPLANQPGFAAAFACKAGNAMQRKEDEQVKLWR